MLIGNVHIARGNEHDLDELFVLLRRDGIEPFGNQDVLVRTYGTFGVDDARELSDKASMRAIGGGRRVFVVASGAITHEAQNALLKMLEEAPGDALFIFLHPAPETLLPTVKSRAQFFKLPQNAETSVVDAQQFLIAAPAQRLDMLKPLLEKGDDEKRNLGAVIAFLSSLEVQLAAVRGHRDGLRAVLRARRYLSDRGALVKPLLEQVALLV